MAGSNQASNYENDYYENTQKKSRTPFEYGDLDIHASEFRGNTSIRPLTVMSIDELEAVLPYTAGNTFSWKEILEERFNRNEVTWFSVHQTVYDFVKHHSKDHTRNEFLLVNTCSSRVLIQSNSRKPSKRPNSEGYFSFLDWRSISLEKV